MRGPDMARTSVCYRCGTVQGALGGLLAGLLGVVTAVAAAPLPLDNEALSEVVGRDGIGLLVHLEVNTSDPGDVSAGARFTRSFAVHGTTTYVTAQGWRGALDLVGVSVDVGARPDGGGSYIDIGLPGTVVARQFGFRTSGVQTDPQATVAPQQSLGGVLLHGSATQSGHFFLWAP